MSYPPAQRRAYTNVLSSRAEDGFKLFHIDGDLQGKPEPNVCGNCHRMPFLVSTNTPGTGMDAPTWRGAYDRWLILPQGRLNIIDFDFYRSIAERGIPERSMWQFSWAGRKRFDPVWDMVLEGSTGFSGAFARQVTFNRRSANARLTDDLLDALELSASEGGIVLQGEGVFIDSAKAKPVALQFDHQFNGGTYVERGDDREAFTRAKLVSLASDGRFVGTFTARHGVNADVNHPQPALWTLGPIQEQRGRQEFPILYGGTTTMTISGRHIRKGAKLMVDGRRVPGTVRSDDETIEVKLATLPSVGMHFLQIQNPDGLFSNDFIFHVTENAQSAKDMKRGNVGRLSELKKANSIWGAAKKGDTESIRQHLAKGADVNGKDDKQATPLHWAAVYGQTEAAELLIGQGADVNGKDGAGSTPLHWAAFLGQPKTVQLLIKKGADVKPRNDNGDTPLDSTKADRGTTQFIAAILEIEIDVEKVIDARPRIAAMLGGEAPKAERDR